MFNASMRRPIPASGLPWQQRRGDFHSFRPLLVLELATLGLAAQARKDAKTGIASANALATEAGFGILARGGNAVDVAITAAHAPEPGMHTPRPGQSEELSP